MKITIFLITLALTGCSNNLSNAPKNLDDDGDLSTQSVKTKKETLNVECRISFEKTIEKLNKNNSFKPLFDFYNSNQHCMDGAYSQGIEGAISKSLDEKWGVISELKSFFEKSPTFESFFFENIGCYVSATETHLEAVVEKSLNSCPGDLNSLCSKILNASKKAIEYSNSQ
jgi:hypothetical protein